MGCVVSEQVVNQGSLGFWFKRRDGTEGRISFFGAPAPEGTSLSQALKGLRAMLEEAKGDPNSVEFVHEFSQVAEQMESYLREHGDWPPAIAAPPAAEKSA